MNSSYLLINRIRTHYLTWNADSNGRNLLLLHGLGESARVWQKAAPDLGKAGFRLLAPDLRGHGSTDDLDDECRLETFLLDLAGFLEATQVERPILVGQGLGAAAAMDFAARVPVGPRSPAGLILVEGGLGVRERPGFLQRMGRVDGLTVEEFLSRLAEVPGKWTPDEADGQILLSYFEIDRDETLLPRLTRDQQDCLQRSLEEHPALERLRKVLCPILVVAARPPAPFDQAELDEMVVKEQFLAKARETHPLLQVRWLEDCTREAALHRPKDLARLVAGFAGALPE